MDTWGIIIFVLGLVLYFALKRQPAFLFVSGLGAGIVIGAVWAVVIVNRVIGELR